MADSYLILGHVFEELCVLEHSVQGTKHGLLGERNAVRVCYTKHRLKRNPEANTYCGTKTKSEAVPLPHVMDSPKLPMSLERRCPSLQGSCLC
jgi:hypothetical protein